MWLDNMSRVQVEGGEYVAPVGFTIKSFCAVNASVAVVKLASKNGSDFAVGGLYANAGLSVLPGERHEGSYSKVTVSSGIVEVFIVQGSDSI